MPPSAEYLRIQHCVKVVKSGTQHARQVSMRRGVAGKRHPTYEICGQPFSHFFIHRKAFRARSCPARSGAGRPAHAVSPAGPLRADRVPPGSGAALPKLQDYRMLMSRRS
ncbi:hypothetical protein MRX96_002865 [Rhipicephalus microplus]